MAPLVVRGMLRTSIILPDPASFTDTSQEQMNASYFDGFMNILDEDGGARGSVVFVEILLLHRTDPTLFSPRFSRRAISLLRAPGTETGVALMEPVAKENSLHLNRRR